MGFQYGTGFMSASGEQISGVLPVILETFCTSAL
jgi:hypothetical protein